MHHHLLLILALTATCGPLAVLLLALATLTAATRLLAAAWRTARNIRAHTRRPPSPGPCRAPTARHARRATPTPQEAAMHSRDRITAIRIELNEHWRCGSDTREIERHLDQLLIEIAAENVELADIRAQLAELLRRTPDHTPAHVTVQVEGTSMSFAPGQTITFTATSDNAEGLPVADDYTWTVSAGTPVAGPDTSSVTVSDAPLGDVTATATDSLGLSGSVTISVVDQTPAVVTVTAA